MQFWESPYSNSVFRYLGILASASKQEMADALKSRANTEKGVAIEVNASPELPLDLPWLEDVGFRRSERYAHFVSDSKARWLSRLYWFHCRDDVDRQAVQAIKSGDYGRAHNLWRGAWDSNKECLFYLHNLAVLHHSRTFAPPRGAELLQKDLQESAYCWNSLIRMRSNALASIMLDGEDEQSAESRSSAEELAKEEGQRIGSILARLMVCALPQIGGFRNVRWMSFPVPVHYLASDVADNSRALLAIKYRLAVEKARVCARYDDFAGVESYLDEAKDNSPSNGAAQAADKLAGELRLEMLRHDLVPVKHQFRLSKGSSLGLSLINTSSIDAITRSYEGDVIFRLCYMPLWYFGRYRVTQDYDEKVVFLGKLPMSTAMKCYNIFVIFLLTVVLLSMAHIDFGMLDTDNHYSSKNFYNGKVTIKKADIKAMRTSASTCGRVHMAVSNSLRQLYERRDALENEIIPDCRYKYSTLPPTVNSLERERLQNELRDAEEELNDVKKNIVITEDFLEYIKKVEARN
ncbi:hypothetical protein IJT17_10125 [bacterium]|nr:hypothetical protein [bacterium]